MHFAGFYFTTMSNCIDFHFATNIIEVHVCIAYDAVAALSLKQNIFYPCCTAPAGMVFQFSCKFSNVLFISQIYTLYEPVDFPRLLRHLGLKFPNFSLNRTHQIYFLKESHKYFFVALGKY